MSDSRFVIVSSYEFRDLPGPQDEAQAWREYLESVPEVSGTVLIAPEGVNFSLCGGSLGWDDAFETWFLGRGYSARLKRSVWDRPAFKRLKVLVKKEIVGLLPQAKLDPAAPVPSLSPQEFERVVHDSSWKVIDLRNDFEFDIGHFEGAEPIGMEAFTDLPRLLEHFPKDQPVAMYCTGGVRCEKAAKYFHTLGWKHVYSLEGGILNYFEQMGRGSWKGECFVFDDRIQVDPQDILPGKEKG